MKAREHLATHFILLILLVIIAIAIWKWEIFYFLFDGEIFLLFVFGAGFYFLGAILPDADSEDKGSYIYYKPLLVPLAYLVHFLEYPLLIITKRDRGHKQSLHTIVGIIIISFVLSLLFSFLYFWLINSTFSIFFLLIWFLCLFTGQFLHLLEDKIKDSEWKIKWI